MPAIVLAGCVVLAAACGGDDDSGDDSSDWQSFTEGPYSGAAQEDWIVAFFDLSGPEVPSIPEGAPAVLEDLLQDLQTQGAPDNLFLVYLDTDPVFATNINILPCAEGEVAAAVSDTDKLLAAHEAEGTAATLKGTMSYNGAEVDMLELEIDERVDSYEVVLETEDCYSQTTLTTRQGETEHLEDFRRFLSELEIDVGQFD